MKTAMTDEIAREFRGVTGCVLVDYRGVPAEAIREFRRRLRTKHLRMRVLRNAIAGRALDTAGLGLVRQAISGPTAAIFGGEGAIAAARAVVEWNRKGPALRPRGAVAEGEVYPASAVPDLARMPDRQALRGMIAGAVIGSARGLAVALAGVPGALARVIQARVDKAAKEGAGASPAPEAKPEGSPS
ncbi:MAG: 50S ribosomal protein L10 [Planctomycetales bacterium]|nr:50S ribosomal protein L10 [Planctomycetales bacterium]